jgi:hypothetical protein
MLPSLPPVPLGVLLALVVYGVMADCTAQDNQRHRHASVSRLRL